MRELAKGWNILPDPTELPALLPSWCLINHCSHELCYTDLKHFIGPGCLLVESIVKVYLSPQQYFYLLPPC